jgi:hypothetical protein
LRGAGQHKKRRLSSAQDCTAGLGVAASGCHAGKDGAESGAAIGVFPALGTTTALCALVAFIWRLNLPAIQIMNYFVYPIQLALILPFFSRGRDFIWRAALAARGVAGCGNGSRELVGLNAVSMDDDLACHGCMVFGGAAICGTGLCAARADLAAWSEADGKRQKRQTDIWPTCKQEMPLENIEDFFVAFERRN